ncbi:sterile alpha motif domain-containing protein 12-like isoform X1 [Phycodurus eques]|uniref:sterile alpha motif domain-containing protein 12-like isoform X1 n=1 Tax=Phycodurus eques TaxID=693459 RepID=UPI002ACE4E78|nr:sterile alpha motif domain-containing protein 12-like isoform X1 [Phycodurus eques]XP_061560696.1 sterile alpha motif domain-containing protein 12-like isoform X1 [Phycodurus eques]
MEASKRVSSWSVQDVLEWIQKCYPSLVGVLQKAIMKHAISGRALLRLREHHLHLLGVDAEDRQQEMLQDLLLLRVQEEVGELDDICSVIHPSAGKVRVTDILAGEEESMTRERM